MPARRKGSTIPYSQQELFGAGLPPRYTGERLAQIAFPLGGIGTGTVSLGGRGDLRDWEIFNRPNKNVLAGFNLFTLRARAGKREPVARVLEARPLPPYTGAHGFRWGSLAGLPHLDSAEFIGEYPIARVRFADDALPLAVELEAYNPFLPLDAEDSGLPVAVFLWTLRNRTKERVTFTLAANFTNLVGWDGSSDVGHRQRHPSLGQNVTEFVSCPGVSGFRMTSRKYGRRHPRFGSMAVATPWKSLTLLAHWPRGAWWDDLHLWWEDFREDGRFADVRRASATEDGKSEVSTLGLRAALRPGQSVTLPVVLAWHFPNRRPYPSRPEGRQVQLTNYYAKRFKDAWDAAEYTVRNLARLDAGTRAFHRTLFSSTLPAAVLDAASSQMSTIRTNTCFRTADGVFHAYEGCSPREGCCPMNCTHVWNYEQALAFLFPSLERTMRETDFLVNTDARGDMVFRTNLPAGSSRWKFRPAADGQMGCILKLYREWKLSGDARWLRKLWPKAKRALEFAWKEWDRNRDGVMEAVQHNTYDIEFLGPNTMTGALYLAALAAGAELARAMGDEKSAARYRRLAEKGSRRLDRITWNGEYFVQKYDPRKASKYQYGSGCLADQLLGQWFAMVVGLGHVLPREHVRRALGAIFENNWKGDLSKHENVQRVYALGDEAGLVLCTWPGGGRPAIPFPYSDEVWTGIEYQVAAHLIYEGMLEEGLSIVKGARSRHDGRRRNPWNEPECGDHYARAMSSWSLILALSGFDFNAAEGRIRFAPKVNPRDFRTFFSTGGAWGSYSQEVEGRKFRARIAVEAGELTLKRIELDIPGRPAGTLTRLRLARPLKLTAGRALRINAKL